MPNQYSIYRVVCSTPPGLEEERDLFLARLASFMEQVTQPQWILFAPASFPTTFDAVRMQGAVKDNIKGSPFFVGFFGEDPPEPPFKRFVQCAIESAADPALPMKKPTLFFKESEDAAPEVGALRARFAEQCEIRTYRTLKDLEPQLEELLAAWLALALSPAAT
jgi:hypothetical protein